MKRILTLTAGLIVLFNIAQAQTITGPLGERFGVRIVASNLADPWEITCGPDGYLWTTESKGYRVSRIDPASGKKTVLLDLNAQREFPRYDKMGDAAQGKPMSAGGLMGMAVHPQLLTGKPYVYLMYIYRYEGANKQGSGCDINYGGCHFKGRVVRYTYNKQAQKLSNPLILCDSIPQSNDHNGSRLALAPVGNKLYLFYSTGDMGAGQFGNAGQPNHAQDKNSYEGKILRFNTEPDKDANLFDRWIPNDNPFNSSRQSGVWSIGHRNPQGLAYAMISHTGYLFESEHGPFGDDEVNIIAKGKNYGHPLVIGHADGNYDGLAAGITDHESLPGKWHTTYPLIENEKTNAAAMGDAYRDPLITLYPNSNAYLSKLFEKNGKQQWPSEAPSSIDVYTANAIPGWQNSVLVPTLKGNKLIRLKLTATGDAIASDTLCYFKNKVRYRDVAISRDGRKIYLATDSTAASSNPSKQNPEQVYNPGSIIEFTYLGIGGGELDKKKVRK
jgi:PQQ-dependent dehydrogenase (s-GDH family)